MKYTVRKSGIGKNTKTRKMAGGHYLHRRNDPLSKKPYKRAIKPFLKGMKRIQKSLVHRYLVSKNPSERKDLKVRIYMAFTKIFHDVAFASNKSIDKEFWYDINDELKGIKTEILNELYQNDQKFTSEELKKAEERRRNNDFLLSVFEPPPVNPSPIPDVDPSLIQDARNLHTEVINARSGSWPTENHDEDIYRWRERLMDIYDSDMPRDENNELYDNALDFVEELNSIDNDINNLSQNITSRGGKTRKCRYETSNKSVPRNSKGVL